jgi:hypothetical protein
MMSIKKMSALFATALVLSSFLSFSQQQIAAIPLKGKIFGFAQCAFSGDTLFVAYRESIDHTAVYRTRLVFRDGTYKVISDSRLMQKPFIGIDNANDSLYVYFLEVKRKTISICFVVDGDSGESHRVAYTLPKEEILLGTFKDPKKKGFSLVTASPTNKTTTLLRAHGSEVIQEQKINLPIPFFEHKLASFALLPEGYTPSPQEAEARTKVYWNSDQVIITEDVPRYYLMKTPGKTTMLSIDPATGKHQIRLLLEPDEIDFSTYVHNNILYKIKKDRKIFTIDVFDSLNKKTHSLKIDKKSSYLNELAFQRNTRSIRASGNTSVRHVLRKQGNVFISIHPAEDDKLLFKVGTHRLLTNPTSFAMVVAFGVVGSAIITGIADAAGYQMYPPEYKDRYFYLSGKSTEFNYVESTNFVHERIDAFENHSKENEFIFKSYAQNRNEVIGIYVMTNAPELRIIRFQK